MEIPYYWKEILCRKLLENQGWTKEKQDNMDDAQKYSMNLHNTTPGDVIRIVSEIFDDEEDEE